MSDHTEFLSRFESLRRRMRTTLVATAVFAAALAAAVGVAALAAADFHFEFSWNARAVLLGGLGGLVLAALAHRLWRIARRWSRPATAAGLEERFPELGQRMRTAVEYGDRSAVALSAEGINPGLVDALEAETSSRTRPVALERVVPARRLVVTGALAAGTLAALAMSGGAHPEWRTALERSLLARTPYTTLSVQPGDLTVDEGAQVTIDVTLTGRPRESVVLLSRPLADPAASWRDQTLAAVETSERLRPRRYSGRLPKMTRPTEYQTVAGPAASEKHTL
ncbi:MAG: hypothetical protein KY476_18690, partial [Planctomycetes bacterium]|nr:hypothetical protein [Planctomycetota bacterium]